MLFARIIIALFVVMAGARAMAQSEDCAQMSREWNYAVHEARNAPVLRFIRCIPELGICNATCEDAQIYKKEMERQRRLEEAMINQCNTTFTTIGGREIGASEFPSNVARLRAAEDEKARKICSEQNRHSDNSPTPRASDAKPSEPQSPSIPDRSDPSSCISSGRSQNSGAYIDWWIKNSCSFGVTFDYDDCDENPQNMRPICVTKTDSVAAHGTYKASNYKKPASPRHYR